MKYSFLFISLIVCMSNSFADMTEIPCDKIELLKPVESKPDEKIGNIGSVEVWKVSRAFNAKEKNGDLEKYGYSCVNLEFRKNSQIIVYNLEQIGLNIPQPVAIRVRLDKNLIKINFLSSDRFKEEGDGYLKVYKFDEKSAEKIKLISRHDIFPEKEKRKVARDKLNTARKQKDLEKAIKLISKLDKDSTGQYSMRNDFFLDYSPLFLKKMKMIFGLKLTKKQKIKTEKMVSAFLSAIVEPRYEKYSLSQTMSDLFYIQNSDVSDKHIKIWEQLSNYVKESPDDDWGIRIRQGEAAW